MPVLASRPAVRSDSGWGGRLRALALAHPLTHTALALCFPLRRGVQIAAALRKSAGPKLKDFRSALEAEEPAALGALRKEVEDFAKQVGRRVPSLA